MSAKQQKFTYVVVIMKIMEVGMSENFDFFQLFENKIRCLRQCGVWSEKPIAALKQVKLFY